MTDSFENAFRFLMWLEGAYSDVPTDPGGPTIYGISQRSHPTAFAEVISQPTEQDKLGAARTFYLRQWWEPMQLDAISDWRVGAEIFEMAVHGGIPWGVRLVQRAVNCFRGMDITEDGTIGPETIGAVNTLIGQGKAAKLIAAINLMQGSRLLHLVQSNPAQYASAFEGWLRRLIPVNCWEETRRF
jgi:type VI secretion system secreted protein VgrG